MPRLFLVLAALLVAPIAVAKPVRVEIDTEPAPLLSAYNLFVDPARQIPSEGVVPYDLNTPHFADYANLRRFLYVPPGDAIEYLPDGSLEYPLGAAVIITIGYLHDLRDPAQGERLVETRLLVRHSEGWKGTQYIWNDETTEAELSLIGGEAEVSWVHTDGQTRDNTFLIPNKNQCKQCHEIDGAFVPLGPMRARYVNKDFLYSHGTENQLAHWTQLGILRGAPSDPDEAERVPVWNDPDTGSLNDRARAYLDMNCSSCHRPGGIAYTSGLDLSYDQTVPVRYGIFKAPVAAGRAGHARFALEPGHPEGSMLLHRLRSTDPGVRMPIVGRGLVHEEGVALIEEWIDRMEFPKMAAAQAKIDQRKKARNGN